LARQRACRAKTGSGRDRGAATDRNPVSGA
jgi:hypothetical protein